MKYDSQIDEIYQKARKINALLSHPSTPAHEAATAAIHLQRMITKYGLNEEKIREKESKQKFGESILCSGNNIRIWKRILAQGIAEALLCAIIIRTTNPRSRLTKLIIMGTSYHRELACWLFQTLQDVAHRNLLSAQHNHGVLSNDEYLKGFAYGLAIAVREALREPDPDPETATGTELIVSGLRHYIEVELGIVKKRERPKINMHSRDLLTGYNDGKKAPIHRPIEQQNAPL
jgi:hypothetical protein